MSILKQSNVSTPQALLESLHRIRLLERDVVTECERRDIPVPAFLLCGHYDRTPGFDFPDGPLCSRCSARRHAAEDAARDFQTDVLARLHLLPDGG